MAVEELERDRAELEDVDERITGFQQAIEEAAASGALDPESLERFVGTIKELAARVNSSVVPEMDSDTAALINARLISILTLDLDEIEALHAADRYLIDLEAIRHVLRDLLDEQRPEALRRQAPEIIAMLESWLPSASVTELAELLGHSVRNLQRRRHEVAAANSREQLVARLVAILRHAWSDAGVIAWFHRVRGDLGGHAPLELLGDPGSEQALLLAARAGRAQGGG